MSPPLLAIPLVAQTFSLPLQCAQTNSLRRISTRGHSLVPLPSDFHVWVECLCERCFFGHACGHMKTKTHSRARLFAGWSPFVCWLVPVCLCDAALLFMRLLSATERSGLPASSSVVRTAICV